MTVKTAHKTCDIRKIFIFMAQFPHISPHTKCAFSVLSLILSHSLFPSPLLLHLQLLPPRVPNCPITATRVSPPSQIYPLPSIKFLSLFPLFPFYLPLIPRHSIHPSFIPACVSDYFNVTLIKSNNQYLAGRGKKI